MHFSPGTTAYGEHPIVRERMREYSQKMKIKISHLPFTLNLRPRGEAVMKETAASMAARHYMHTLKGKTAK